VNVVVDTNIVFSALLSPKGTISDILLNSSGLFNFFSPTYLLDELDHHHQKLLKISGYSEQDVSFLKRIVFKKIELIDIVLLGEPIWQEAVKMTSPIVEFDAPFVALCLAMDAVLWTGDRKLAIGLALLDLDWIKNTSDLKQIRDKQ